MEVKRLHAKVNEIMKKINLLILVAVLATYFSCNIERKSETTTQEKTTKKSFTNFSEKNYRGQLVYSKPPANDENNINEMGLKYNFGEKIFDSNTTWDYFDKIYNDTLSVTNKQYLSYIILSTKDLIGLYSKDKNNEILEKKLIFHTKSLVDSDYIGYCLLYYSFDALKRKYPDMIKAFKNKVINYSAGDKWHKEILENKELEKSEMSLYYKKVKENYGYLDKIKELK